MEGYVLLKRWCILFDLPSDVTRYLIIHFYAPFVKAERERSVLNQLYYQLVTKGRTYAMPPLSDATQQLREEGEPEPLDAYRQLDAEYEAERIFTELLRNKWFEFDIRIEDDRLEKCLTLLSKIHFKTEDRKIIVYVVVLALRRDYSLSLGLIRDHGITGECYEELQDLFVPLITKTMASQTIWRMYTGIRAIIVYFLEEEIDQPILEWLTVWQHKGNDPFYQLEECLMPNLAARLAKLREKQRSPEMKARRIRFYLTGQ